MKCMKKSAQSLLEYGLILALIAVIAISVLSKLGQSITKTGTSTASTVNDVSANSMDNYCTEVGQGTYDSAAAACTGG